MIVCLAPLLFLSHKLLKGSSALTGSLQTLTWHCLHKKNCALGAKYSTTGHDSRESWVVTRVGERRKRTKSRAAFVLVNCPAAQPPPPLDRPGVLPCGD